MKRLRPLGLLLKKQPAFGYHQAMYRAVLTLLVGLMLSLSGGASALTFKSDGTVVQSDGKVLKQASSQIEASYETALKYQNKKFEEHRKLKIHSGSEVVVTVTAFDQWKSFTGWKAKGIFFLGTEICVWNSSITSNDGTGKFHAKCPTNDVRGRYKVTGLRSGSSGQGKDKNGKEYSYVLSAAADSQEQNYRELLDLYLTKDIASIAFLANRKNFLIGNDIGRGFSSTPAGDIALCSMATLEGSWEKTEKHMPYVLEAKRRGLTCGVGESASKQTVTANPLSNKGAELEAEREKRIQLEQELAALKAQQEQQQQTITNDNQIPLIEVSSQQKDEATALVYGRATDNVEVAAVLINEEQVQLGSDGSFQTQLYIPPSGVVVEITAYDLKGNKASKTLSLVQQESEDAPGTKFTQLQPSLGKRGAINRNAIALIVGVEKYENLPAIPAIHADKDAEYFADFAHYKLGIPRNNIITAINSDAKRLDILKAITKVTKLSTKDKTEVFIFFAGHGLAATDGQDVFLLPYDGDKDYLDATAMTRDEIFQLVERIEPKSVTVFLDACYTGGTRSEDITLVAGKRPVRVEALNQSVPKGFTILSASASDETSMALEAAEHGMFSYFLMKGMEGDADADNDNQITMAEMRDYVKDKVVRQSNFRQTPGLQGDADRVLVRFQ